MQKFGSTCDLIVFLLQTRLAESKTFTLKLFGNSVSYIDYVECSDPGSRKMNQTCKDAKVEGYPTWKFKDGSSVSGEQSLEYLGEKTGCELPTIK